MVIFPQQDNRQSEIIKNGQKIISLRHVVGWFQDEPAICNMYGPGFKSHLYLKEKKRGGGQEMQSRQPQRPEARCLSQIASLVTLSLCQSVLGGRLPHLPRPPPLFFSAPLVSWRGSNQCSHIFISCRLNIWLVSCE